MRCRLTVFGDQGMLTADWKGWGSPEKIWIDNMDGHEPLAIEIPDSNAGAEFVSAIKGGIPNLASAQEGAHAVALTEAVYRSAAEGRIIEVETL